MLLPLLTLNLTMASEPNITNVQKCNTIINTNNRTLLNKKEVALRQFELGFTPLFNGLLVLVIRRQVYGMGLENLICKKMSKSPHPRVYLPVKFPTKAKLAVPIFRLAGRGPTVQSPGA